MAVVKLSDVIVPEIFTPYMMQETMQKSALIRSGAIARDPFLDDFLAGAGATINVPSYKDLDDTDENISSDDAADSTPNNINTLQEIAVRMNRNNSWGAADLVQNLIGNDPMQAIASRVSAYWTRRLQKAYIAVMTGLYADNSAAPSGGDTHTQYDMTHDISGASYVAGVTDFSAEAVIDACVLMGDGLDSLTMVMMHSVVYARALKNNLIDFIPDSSNGGATRIATFLGREVIVDDGVPNTGGVFQTWLCGPRSVRLGFGSAKVPTEIERSAKANNGAGEEVLHSRIELAIHPTGYQYIGTGYGVGGPSNAATSGNLAHASSWRRVYPERKMVRIARLVTREY